MTEYKAYGDTELLLNIKVGSEPAFRQLYERYAPKVYNMSMKYLDNPFLAQDTVQDVFTRVWQHREELTEVQHFEAWLTRVTRNNLINQLKKKIPVALVEDGELYHPPVDRPSARPVQRTEYRELVALIEQAIGQLPARPRQVYLFRQEGLSHKEIAAEMNISYNTVREHMSKALAGIRQFLESHYEYLFPLLYVYLTRELL